MPTNNAWNSQNPAQVAKGGTGNTTLNTNGVLLGHGVDPITATLAGTDGQVLLGSSGASPAFADLTSTNGSLNITAGANSLDVGSKNYVKPTSFTPGISFGGGSEGMTFSDRNGWYTQVNNIVGFSIAFTVNNKGTSTGVARLTGLPVPALGAFIPIGLWSNIVLIPGYSEIFAQSEENTTNFLLGQSGNNTTAAPLNDTHFGNVFGMALTGSFIYEESGITFPFSSGLQSL